MLCFAERIVCYLQYLCCVSTCSCAVISLDSRSLFSLRTLCLSSYSSSNCTSICFSYTHTAKEPLGNMEVSNCERPMIVFQILCAHLLTAGQSDLLHLLIFTVKLFRVCLFQSLHLHFQTKFSLNHTHTDYVRLT